MASATQLFEVGDNVLERVVHLLNYSSTVSFYEEVRKIKEWIKKHPHFSETMAERKIQNFLILNKGSVERSKQKIENYYSLRTRLPHIFDNINPNLPYMNEHTLKAAYCIPLPKLTKQLYRVFLSKIRDPSLGEQIDPIDILRLIVNIQELRLIEDVAYGDVLIFDGKYIPAKYLLKLTPTLIYNALTAIYKNVFSNRLKAVYVINAPPTVEKFVNVLKKIVKPKIFERIHFCKNWDFVVEQIGEEILPVDCGGKEKSLEELQEMLRQKFKEHEAYFDQLDNLLIKKELRPQNFENEEMFGFPGNFKKLEID